MGRDEARNVTGTLASTLCDMGGNMLYLDLHFQGHFVPEVLNIDCRSIRLDEEIVVQKILQPSKLLGLLFLSDNGGSGKMWSDPG